MLSTCKIVATIIIGITIYLTARTELMTATMHAINEGILTKKNHSIIINEYFLIRSRSEAFSVEDKLSTLNMLTNYYSYIDKNTTIYKNTTFN